MAEVGENAGKQILEAAKAAFEAATNKEREYWERAASASKLKFLAQVFNAYTGKLLWIDSRDGICVVDPIGHLRRQAEVLVMSGNAAGVAQIAQQIAMMEQMGQDGFTAPGSPEFPTHDEIGQWVPPGTDDDDDGDTASS